MLDFVFWTVVFQEIGTRKAKGKVKLICVEWMFNNWCELEFVTRELR